MYKSDRNAFASKQLRYHHLSISPPGRSRLGPLCMTLNTKHTDYWIAQKAIGTMSQSRIPTREEVFSLCPGPGSGGRFSPDDLLREICSLGTWAASQVPVSVPLFRRPRLPRVTSMAQSMACKSERNNWTGRRDLVIQRKSSAHSDRPALSSENRTTNPGIISAELRLYRDMEEIDRTIFAWRPHHGCLTRSGTAAGVPAQ